MSDFITWGTVGLTERVEVRTGGSTAVGVVTELVNVESSLSVGVVTGNLPGDFGWFFFLGLREVNDARNTGFTSKNSDYFSRLVHQRSLRRRLASKQTDRFELLLRCRSIAPKCH